MESSRPKTSGIHRSKWFKFFRYLTRLTHCPAVLLYAAASVVHVEADEFTNTSDLKRIESQDDYDVLSSTVSPMGRATPTSQYVQPHEEYLVMWAEVSKVLLIMILIISILSIFILAQALYFMLTRYKRSVYFDFLTAMIVNDLVMLTIIIFLMCTDSLFPIFKGPALCKITAFLTNVARCYVNWLWVGMYAQRFAYIYSSVHNQRGFLSFFEDSRTLLFHIGVASVITQLYVPFLLTEVNYIYPNNQVATICGPDRSVISDNIIKWLTIGESFWIYFMPFLITVMTDFAVLIFTRESKWLITISSKTITQNEGQLPLSLKIQSEESIRAAHRRRRFAIRRCLALATTQLCLNLPYHIITLLSDFTSLRRLNPVLEKVFLYGDSLFYLLFLLQFPLIAVFVRLLHTNYDDRARRQSKNRRQRTLLEDGHSSFSAPVTRSKRWSTELEVLSTHRHSHITLDNSHQF